MLLSLAACGGGGGGGGSAGPGGGPPDPDPEGLPTVAEALGPDGEPLEGGVPLGAGAAEPGPATLARPQRLSVLSVSPAPQAVPTAEPEIEVRFDWPLKRASLAGALRVAARWSGPIAGELELEDGGRTVRFVPAEPIGAGERVTVSLTGGVESLFGTRLRPEGFAWSFWWPAGQGSLVYTSAQTLSQRTDGSPTQTYGGFAADLDGDGWLDLATTNEVSADLRVALNRGDGSGTFETSLGVFPTDAQSSPNEPADFNGDGAVDCCVANPTAGTVSILLGHGDGTFAPQQLVAVGPLPRGICVLDVDVDGDLDVVCTTAGTDELAILANDGSGVFGSPVHLATGRTGVWGLCADDMDGDGIPDLVVGVRFAERVLVLRGRGDGGFELVTDVPAGAAVWQISTGDVNGDGHADVAVAGGLSDRGTILFGDGTGGLGAPAVYPSDPWCTATDLADADGDGDLDWNLSSFFGDYTLYVNDGTGAFTFSQHLPATSAASCSIFFDANRDGRLDLALVDEVADTLSILLGGAP